MDGTVDRLIGRRAGDRPTAPGHLDVTIPTAVDDLPPEPETGASPGRQSVSGHYAGPVTRLLALATDMFVGFGTYGFFGAATTYLMSTITGVDFTITSGGWLSAVLRAQLQACVRRRPD